MNFSESEINDQMRKARSLETLLRLYSSDYRMGPMGSVKHPSGDVTPIFVLLQAGQSRGTFYSVLDVVNAVQDTKLKQEMLKAIER